MTTRYAIATAQMVATTNVFNLEFVSALLVRVFMIDTSKWMCECVAEGFEEPCRRGEIFVINLSINLSH